MVATFCSNRIDSYGVHAQKIGAALEHLLAAETADSPYAHISCRGQSGKTVEHTVAAAGIDSVITHNSAGSDIRSSCQVVAAAIDIVQTMRTNRTAYSDVACSMNTGCCLAVIAIDEHLLTAVGTDGIDGDSRCWVKPDTAVEHMVAAVVANNGRTEYGPCRCQIGAGIEHIVVCTWCYFRCGQYESAYIHQSQATVEHKLVAVFLQACNRQIELAQIRNTVTAVEDVTICLRTKFATRQNVVIEIQCGTTFEHIRASCQSDRVCRYVR